MKTLSKFIITLIISEIALIGLSLFIKINHLEFYFSRFLFVLTLIISIVLTIILLYYLALSLIGNLRNKE
jgi:hypothetical protein